jgi:hypothetical protein
LLSLRPLGESPPREVKNTFTPFANGNNLVLADDMVRRGVRLGLDANCERPHLRTFDSDPFAEILEHRGDYIAACLTIARYYIAAGWPNLRPRLGSYGRWSDLVRSVLCHLGLADCIETQQELRRDDPVTQHRVAIFRGWCELRTLLPEHHRGFRVKELIEAAVNNQNSDLLEALMEVAESQGPGAGKLDRNRVTRWLMQNENTIADGVKLICDRSDASRPRWRLEPVVANDE